MRDDAVLTILNPNHPAECGMWQMILARSYLKNMFG
jgi:hypothetical protein